MYRCTHTYAHAADSVLHSDLTIQHRVLRFGGKKLNLKRCSSVLLRTVETKQTKRNERNKDNKEHVQKKNEGHKKRRNKRKTRTRKKRYCQSQHCVYQIEATKIKSHEQVKSKHKNSK